jgi:hypothetical protein
MKLQKFYETETNIQRLNVIVSTPALSQMDPCPQSTHIFCFFPDSLKPNI